LQVDNVVQLSRKMKLFDRSDDSLKCTFSFHLALFDPNDIVRRREKANASCKDRDVVGVEETLLCITP
jgi:hypothetical protein